MTKDEIRYELVDIAQKAVDLYADEKLNLVDALLKNGVTIQRWIPVSEMLPWTDGAPGYNDDFFLVCFTGELQEVECRGFMFTATYDGDGKWSLPFRPYEDVTDGVTHWTVLHEPPKEET
jgi:hypothetical protein